VIFEDDETGVWWVTGYVNVSDDENVDLLLGPFDSFDEAQAAARRARYGVLHLEEP
jgi:hypothetical protein